MNRLRIAAMLFGIATATKPAGAQPRQDPFQGLQQEICRGGKLDKAERLDTMADTVFVISTRAATVDRKGRDQVGPLTYYRVRASIREPFRRGYYQDMDSPMCWISSVDTLSGSQLFNEVRDRLGTAGPWNHRALFFVHGFNNSLGDAVDRAVEIKHRLRFDGTLIVFSWPSEGHPLPTIESYLRDSVRAMRTVPVLKHTLSTLTGAADPQRIHLVAHSMGSRILIRALEELRLPSSSPYAGRRFAAATFLAPDVDTVEFKAAVPRLHATTNRVTLYATEGDRALRASSALQQLSALFSARIRSRRAGETFPPNRRALRAHGLETIVIPAHVWSIWDSSIWGLRHALYTESTPLYDLFWNVSRDARAGCRAERGLAEPRPVSEDSTGRKKFLSEEDQSRLNAESEGVWELLSPNEEVQRSRQPSPECALQIDPLRPADPPVTTVVGAPPATVASAVAKLLAIEGYDDEGELCTRPGTTPGSLILQTSDGVPMWDLVITVRVSPVAPVTTGVSAPRAVGSYIEITGVERAATPDERQHDASLSRVAFILRRLVRAIPSAVETKAAPSFRIGSCRELALRP